MSAKRTPTAFLTNGTPYQSALARSHWLVFQRAQKLSVVTEDDRASKYLGAPARQARLAAAQAAFPADGARGHDDWSRYAKKALAGEPDVVYWAGSAAGGGALVAALRDAGYDGKFVATAAVREPPSSSPPPGTPPRARS